MVDVAKAFRARLADPVDIRLQPRLAMRERQFAQVLVALEQQVEGEIDQVVGAAVRDRGLEGRKVGHVVGVERAQFTVDHGVRPARGVSGQGRKPVAPVQSLAGTEHCLAAAHADLDAIAVEFDLMRPTGAGRMIGDLAQLDGDEGRRFGGLARGGLRRFGLGRGLAAGRLGRCPLGLVPGDFGQRPAGRHRGVDLGERVALARHGVIILLLDQQPVVALLSAFLGLAAIGLEPDQRPAAFQPLAVQRHLDRALGEIGLKGVGMLRRPGAHVPQLDRARAVVAGGNGSFERPIVHGMILDLDRQPFHRGVARGRLGHRPGLEHAVVFDAEIVVQPRRRVALDQIAERLRSLAPGLCALGFGRLAEASFCLVGLELAAHAVPGVCRGGQRVTRTWDQCADGAPFDRRFATA